ncbi:MAG TPA: endonuclease/exonuclease/phosphatase family protein [Myxococcales bacterium]|nr:endonuclease/exonuclease/phosphatase family protein [Myxococcales bacterium]
MIVVSWNVLADAYLRPEYYRRVDPALLVKGARTQAIVEKVIGFEAEVVCLQEAEPALVEALRARQLTVHFAQKHGRPDGSAIVSKLTAENIRALHYDDGAPDRAGSGHVALLATIAGLTIASTHLRWDKPGTAANDRWAVREARQLIAEKPDIVCGDFNFEPGDEVYAMFEQAGFTDAGAHAPTANPNGQAKRIDYLWCGPGLRTEPLPVMPIDGETPLPSAIMPSDHLPISARFTREHQ